MQDFVEIGQYFMTRETLKNSSLRGLVVNTLFQEVITTKRMDSGKPVLETTTSCLYGKHGIEIGIWFLSKDNSQSWVRISHGSNRFVIDSNYNNTEVLADLPEEPSVTNECEGYCSQIKGKIKTTKERNC